MGRVVKAGTSNRWGDYSALVIDPVDDTTFWYTNEYYTNTGSFNWRTRIGSFKIAIGKSYANADSYADTNSHSYANAYPDTSSELLTLD